MLALPKGRAWVWSRKVAHAQEGCPATMVPQSLMIPLAFTISAEHILAADAQGHKGCL